jgi:ribosomal protein S12
MRLDISQPKSTFEISPSMANLMFKKNGILSPKQPNSDIKKQVLNQKIQPTAYVEPTIENQENNQQNSTQDMLNTILVNGMSN